MSTEPQEEPTVRTTLQKKEPHGLTGRELTRSSYRPRPTQAPPAMLDDAGRWAAGSPSQVRPERTRRQRKDGRSAFSQTRPWIGWAIGGCAALSGFVAVLWLTRPVAAPNTPAIAALTSATVSDGASLMAAVQTARLRGSEDVKGAIDEIKRLDNERVIIKGWATDITAPGSALTVIAFTGGKHVLTAVTEGARPDIARGFGLADASAKNMSFQGAFACRAGEKIVVIAVTSGAAYSQFRSLTCP